MTLHSALVALHNAVFRVAFGPAAPARLSVCCLDAAVRGWGKDRLETCPKASKLTFHLEFHLKDFAFDKLFASVPFLR